MKRSTLLRRTPMRRAQPAPHSTRERAPMVIAPRPADAPRAVMAFCSPTPATAVPKTPDRVDHRIRQSARDELCTVRIPGCPNDPALTIWSHNRHARAGKGGGMKAICLNGAYACSCWCDAIYDGQRPLPPGITREQVELAWYHGHAESLVRLKQKGLA